MRTERGNKQEIKRELDDNCVHRIFIYEVINILLIIVCEGIERTVNWANIVILTVHVFLGGTRSALSRSNMIFHTRHNKTFCSGQIHSVSRCSSYFRLLIFVDMARFSSLHKYLARLCNFRAPLLNFGSSGCFLSLPPR